MLLEILTAISILFLVLSLSLLRLRAPQRPFHKRDDLMTPKGQFRSSKSGIALRIFLWGLSLRLLVLLVLSFMNAMETFELSRDSVSYHMRGMLIAEDMSQGDFNWPNWIDNGWYQFTGLIYYLFGPYPLILQTLNAILGAFSASLIYITAEKVFQDIRVAYFAGMLTALFPSFVYWSALPLKDATSLFSFTLMVWAVVNLRESFSPRYFVYLAITLLLLLSVRDYMFFVSLSLILVSLAPISSKRAVRISLTLVSAIIFLGVLASLFGFGFFGADYVATSKYFDLDYINYNRGKMNKGYGGFFDDPSTIQWGSGLTSDFFNILAAGYYFFFSIDPMEIGRGRQLLALPEMFFFVLALPSLIKGIRQIVRDHFNRALPILVFAFGIMIVYSSATTNMGAMFRWRMQALPFFLMIIGYGVSVRRKGILMRLMNILYREKKYADHYQRR